MPYIGNTPALDYISFAVQNFTVTAGTTVYTLDYSVSNENDIALYINSVAQRPGASYAYSATGTTLTLTSATLATDTMYAVFIGRAVQTVVPPASSVTNTMLSPSVITGQTAETSVAGGDLVLVYDDSASALRKMTRTNFVSGLSVANTPAFYAYKSGNQTISDSTSTEIQFNAEYYDTNNCFNTSTYRFTPTTAGKYLLIASIGIDENTTFNRYILYLFKNGGSPFTQRRTFYYGTNEQTILNIGIFEANGSSDYFSVNIFQDSGGTTTLLADGAYTYFQGFKIIE
jgi:hypothetical protein